MGIISILYVLELGESKLVLYFIAIRVILNVWKLLLMRGIVVSLRQWPPVRYDEEIARANKKASVVEVSNAEWRCMKWLMLALLPLLLGFSIYRLVYYTFKGW